MGRKEDNQSVWGKNLGRGGQAHHSAASGYHGSLTGTFWFAHITLKLYQFASKKQEW